MTREKANNIARGIADKIEATTDIDDWAKFWGFTRDDYEEFLDMATEALEEKPCEDCISRQAVLDLVEDMTDQFGVEHRVVTEGMISLLPSVTPKPKTDALDKIKAEIKEWYWQADKQALAKDPCVVDAMIDLFIRTINKYKAESEDKE